MYAKGSKIMNSLSNDNRFNIDFLSIMKITQKRD